MFELKVKAVAIVILKTFIKLINFIQTNSDFERGNRNLDKQATP